MIMACTYMYAKQQQYTVQYNQGSFLPSDLSCQNRRIIKICADAKGTNFRQQVNNFQDTLQVLIFFQGFQIISQCQYLAVSFLIRSQTGDLQVYWIQSFYRLASFCLYFFKVRVILLWHVTFPKNAAQLKFVMNSREKQIIKNNTIERLIQCSGCNLVCDTIAAQLCFFIQYILRQGYCFFDERISRVFYFKDDLYSNELCIAVMDKYYQNKVRILDTFVVKDQALHTPQNRNTKYCLQLGFDYFVLSVAFFKFCRQWITYQGTYFMLYVRQFTILLMYVIVTIITISKDCGGIQLLQP
eukprot:TRINITY_DN3272_c3_g1_i3.p2 TRINITY_DN3272_c3_g1~~TRINITY_DN3272_c3_g1_i3.p2  ORF type:complete len:299 (-),score=-4.96 TRINITY_DN3272_c3_g1_i3:623-1519(-)